MTNADDPRTLEERRRDERVIDGRASIDDHLSFALDELQQADAALPPNCPPPGDVFHASCCVERAMSSIRLARRLAGVK